MPMTLAERQKRFREKLKNDPVKHEEVKRKQRERMKRIKKKPISLLTEKQKKKRREQWRKASRKRSETKARQKAEKSLNIEVDQTDESTSLQPITVPLLGSDPMNNPTDELDSINSDDLEENENNLTYVELKEQVKKQENIINKLTKENLELKKMCRSQNLDMEHMNVVNSTTDKVRKDFRYCQIL